MSRFSDHLLEGDHASRPAATAVPAGTLYSCSDHQLVYQSDGTTWSTWASLGSTETLPASIIDAKGDLIVGTAADTPAKLALGATDGHVLTKDAAEATGMKWAAVGGGGGGGAWTLLSSTVLGSAATFDVSSISGAYNDLILVMALRSTEPAQIDCSVNMKINNDSGGNYDYSSIRNNNASLSGASGYAGIPIVGKVPGPSSPSGRFGALEVILHSYASTAHHKPFRFSYYHSGFTSAAGIHTGTGGGTWWNTAAINRITLGSGSGMANWEVGSSLRIYGRL